MATKTKMSGAMRTTYSEKAIGAFLLLCALISIAALVIIFVLLITNAAPAFLQLSIWDFLSGSNWNPGGFPPSFGILPLMISTLLVTVTAAAIAIPIGIGCTIYLAEMAHPRIRAIAKPAIEILAGIPSIIYGLFAVLVLTQFVYDWFDPVSRKNGMVGAIMLAVMMIPILVTLAEDAMNSVPQNLREAALAMGATKWEVIRGVIIPASFSGIVAAVILSLGRAIGETMVVLMATGNSTHLTWNIFDSMQTMTAAIAIDYGELSPGTLHYEVIFAVGLVLFIITFVVNYLAGRIMKRFTEEYQ
ncbi:MAG: phosphate ABC transporter permease subunit PstC [Methanomassiliicoccales archaeon]